MVYRQQWIPNTPYRLLTKKKRRKTLNVVGSLFKSVWRRDAQYGRGIVYIRIRAMGDGGNTLLFVLSAVFTFDIALIRMKLFGDRILLRDANIVN